MTPLYHWCENNRERRQQNEEAARIWTQFSACTQHARKRSIDYNIGTYITCSTHRPHPFSYALLLFIHFMHGMLAESCNVSYVNNN
jgi:hypothetical protein